MLHLPYILSEILRKGIQTQKYQPLTQPLFCHFGAAASFYLLISIIHYKAQLMAGFHSYSQTSQFINGNKNAHMLWRDDAI